MTWLGDAVLTREDDFRFVSFGEERCRDPPSANSRCESRCVEAEHHALSRRETSPKAECHRFCKLIRRWPRQYGQGLPSPIHPGQEELLLVPSPCTLGVPATIPIKGGYLKEGYPPEGRHSCGPSCPEAGPKRTAHPVDASSVPGQFRQRDPHLVVPWDRMR